VQKDDLTELINRAAIVAILLILVGFVPSLPGTNQTIFEGRATVGLLLNACIALTIVVLLSYAVAPVERLLKNLVDTQIKKDTGRIFPFLIRIVYVVAAYKLIAKPVESPNNPFLGSPLYFLDSISDNNFQWLYGVAKWAALLGIVVHVILLLVEFNKVIGETVSSLPSPLAPPTPSESSNCPSCGRRLEGDPNFCPSCGQKLKG